ncbi:MAG: hypothetical protein QW594_03805 [Candidatus Woesearchaeota archaeon]
MAKTAFFFPKQRSYTKAEVGIGTLILFIAGIIVAALAAGTLLQTSQSLQSKALATGTQAREMIGSRLEFVSLLATDGSDGFIDDFKLELRLGAGTAAVDLSALHLGLTLHNGSVTYTYSNKSCTRVAYPSQNGYYVNTTTKKGTFTVYYRKESQNHIPGMLQSGELVVLCFGSVYSIGQEEQLRIELVPPKGFSVGKTLYTPLVMVDKNILLYR